MEIKIKQNVLKRELGFLQGVIERKTTIPVLSHLLIETTGQDSIRITGTDLDATIRCDMEANVIKGGSVCLQARRLTDIVRNLDDCEMHFKMDENNWVQLKAARSKFRLPGINRETFPEVPTMKEAAISFPAEVLDYMITHTAFAIMNDQSRFTLSGAKFVLDGKAVRMVTTDGHRLCFIEKKLSEAAGKKIDTLIPKKALVEVAKIARDQGGVIKIGEDPHHIFFEGEKRLLSTRKLSGQFPNYEMVMPKENDQKAVFDLNEMRAAVRLISLMASSTSRTIKLTFRNGKCEVHAASSEEGEGTEVVPVDYKGEERLIAFNWHYFYEFLNSVGIDTELEGNSEDSEKKSEKLRVAFEFKDSGSPTQSSIDGDTGYDYRYIVMPLRV